jgi:uncharacterized protein (UPF0332 family)
LRADIEAVLERGNDDLAAAGHLAKAGFSAQAVSRTYYAAFHAAEAALLALGETRSKHSGVVAAFGRLVVRGGGFDEEVGRLLRSLFERRNEADYGGITATQEAADAAIRDAERFVGAVEAWLVSRER